MTQTELLTLLNAIEFPRLYWELCDRFPRYPTGSPNSGRKEDVITAFATVQVSARYDARDKSFTFESEQIGDIIWSGVFVKQQHGVEPMICGKSKGERLGSNLAVLAYEAKCLADPTFKRNQFQGPPPYPRPAHNGDPSALREIVMQCVVLVRLIKDALRRRITAQ